jgi:hypothetical protein
MQAYLQSLKKIFDIQHESAQFVYRLVRGRKPATKLYENEIEITPEEQLMALQRKLLCEQSLRECRFNRTDAIRLNTFINIYREIYSLTAVHESMNKNELVDNSTQLKPINVYQNLQIIEQHRRLEAVVATSPARLFVAPPLPCPMPAQQQPIPMPGRPSKADPANYTTTRRRYNKKNNFKFFFLSDCYET